MKKWGTFRLTQTICSGAVVRGLPGRRKITKCALQAIIHNKIFEKLGIYQKKPGISLHSLRHYFATKLLENGESIYTIMRLLGHTRMDTTQLYLHGSEEDLKNAASRL